MAPRYDLVVIGGGTAGLVSSIGAASLGARVALVERERLGGECLYTGCVPTKTLAKSARVASLIKRSEKFGIKSGGVEVDLPAVMDRMDEAIRVAGEHDEPDYVRKQGVEVFTGHEAHFEGPDQISVDGRRLTTRSAIIATGSHSIAPPINGIEEVGYLTHVEALKLRRLPRSIVIIGAGPIGCEFAQIFARFGSEVTLLDTVSLPLPREEPEIGALTKRILASDGVTFRGGYRIKEARKEGGEKVLAAASEEGERIEVRGDEVLIAAGRAPTVDGLGLKNAGVELQERGLRVDMLTDVLEGERSPVRRRWSGRRGRRRTAAGGPTGRALQARRGGREPGRARSRGAVGGGGLRRRDGPQDLRRRRFQGSVKEKDEIEKGRQY